MSANTIFQPINVVMVGQGSPGKTCISRRFVTGEFVTSHPTVVLEKHTKENFSTLFVRNFKDEEIHRSTAQSKEENSVRIEIWDTAEGDKDWNVIRPFYISSSREAIIIVFDRTNNESFECAQNLAQIICGERSGDDVIFALVANKIDQFDETEGKIEDERIKNLAEKNNMKFFAVSAQNGTNIEELFEYITDKVIKDRILNIKRKKEMEEMMKKEFDQINQPPQWRHCSIA